VDKTILTHVIRGIGQFVPLFFPGIRYDRPEMSYGSRPLKTPHLVVDRAIER
jgi:hypothetical protein